jgi:hypothetical protein
MIHFNITLPSSPRSLKWHLPVHILICKTSIRNFNKLNGLTAMERFERFLKLAAYISRDFTLLATAYA